MHWSVFTHVHMWVCASRATGDVCCQGSLITVGSTRNKTWVLVLSGENMSPAVTVLTTVFLPALLMLGGLGGAAAFGSQVYGKSINSDKTLLSSNDGRHTMKKHPHQQVRTV